MNGFRTELINKIVGFNPHITIQSYDEKGIDLSKLQYNELSKINGRKDLFEFKKKVIDRFGPLPEEAKELIKSVDVKRIGSKIGIERFIIKQDKCLGYFIQNEEDEIYKNPTFINFLNNIQNKSSKAIISKKKTKKGMKLILTVEDVKKIDDLLNLLENLIKDSSGP